MIEPVAANSESTGKERILVLHVDPEASSFSNLP